MSIAKNIEVRQAIKKAAIKYWQVADKIGITDGNFSRLLRHELSPEKKAEIFSAIAELRKEKEGV